MMSDRQYKTAMAGITEQLRTARRLHCKQVEKRLLQAAERLRLRYLRPDKAGVYNLESWCTTTKYDL